MAEMDVKTFVVKVGAQALMDQVGVGHQMISRACKKGTMPPHWYKGARDLAQKAGMKDAPTALFDFNEPVKKDSAA